jgi:hypothetical protein
MSETLSKTNNVIAPVRKVHWTGQKMEENGRKSTGEGE